MPEIILPRPMVGLLALALTAVLWPEMRRASNLTPGSAAADD